MVTVFHPSQAPAVIQRRNYLHTATQAEIFFFGKKPYRWKKHICGWKEENHLPTFPRLQQNRKKKKIATPLPIPSTSQILSGKGTQSSNLQVKRYVDQPLQAPCVSTPGLF